MLTHPTHERLITLGLTGMAKAFEEQRRSPDLDALPFEERIGLLVDREAAERDKAYSLRYSLTAMLAQRKRIDVNDPEMIDAKAKVLTDDFAPVETLKGIERHNRKLN